MTSPAADEQPDRPRSPRHRPSPSVGRSRPSTTAARAPTSTTGCGPREPPEVTAYLEAENAWTAAATDHLRRLRETIFGEIKSRTKETDLSVPTRNRGWWYYGRSFEGREYGTLVPRAGPRPDDWTPPSPGRGRRAGPAGAPGRAGPPRPRRPRRRATSSTPSAASPSARTQPSWRSPPTRWATSATSSRSRTSRPVSCCPTASRACSAAGSGAPTAATSTTAPSTSPGAATRSGAIAWARTEPDELVFHETDERFWVGIGRSRTQRFLVDRPRRPRTPRRTATWTAPTRTPTGCSSTRGRRACSTTSSTPSSRGEDRFLVLHDHAGADFEVGSTPIAATPPSGWTPFIPYDEQRPARGRRGVRRTSGGAPAQRWADPAPHRRAR